MKEVCLKLRQRVVSARSIYRSVYSACGVGGRVFNFDLFAPISITYREGISVKVNNRCLREEYFYLMMIAVEPFKCLGAPNSGQHSLIQSTIPGTVQVPVKKVQCFNVQRKPE